MAKRKRAMTAETIARWIREGRGSGEGATYQPWYTIQDVASRGRCHRIPDWFTGRVHHLLSDLEAHVFFSLIWSEFKIDVMEQYPLLPLEETLAIAEEVGVRHPADPRSHHPIVMTSDFFLKLNLKSGHDYLVRTAKYESALEDARTLEKLEIERRFWAVRRIDWGIYTEAGIQKDLVENVKWCYPFYAPSSLDPLIKADINKIASDLTRAVLTTDAPLRRITSQCDYRLGLDPGRSLAVVRHLLATRYWTVNMERRIRQGQRLTMLAAPEFEL